MTGAASRRRGADAERAVVAWMRAHGWPDARRYLAGDGCQPGDIDAIPGVCIEVKDVEQSAWPSWCAQAVAEAGDRVPVVVRRTRGTPDVGTWRARIRYDDWVDAGGDIGEPVLCYRTVPGAWVDAPFAAVLALFGAAS